MKNITKINYFFSVFALIALPLILILNINMSSKKTYEKKYYIIKENDVNYFRPINLNSKPIINKVTLAKYIEEVTIDLFNYNPKIKNEYYKKIESHFTEESFNMYKLNFDYLSSVEIANGAELKKTVILSGPYLVGEGKLITGERVWKYAVRTQELLIGLGQRNYSTRDVNIILKEIPYSKNKKGVAIDSIYLP